jgi:O-Antigen ligase
MARRRRPRGVREGTPTTSAADRLVQLGLGAILLAGPITVIGGAMSPYDDPKAWALQILVGLTGLAWLWRRATTGEEAGTGAPDAGLRWLCWILVAYGLWWVVTTVFSIAPWQSVWGSFARGFGLFSVLAVLLCFWLVQSEVRRPDGANCLLDLALLGSVPVVLLALGQALRWDPLPRPWDPAIMNLPVRSTFGQHVLLGGYLAAVCPLALGRLAALGPDRSSPPGESRQPAWRPVFGGVGWAAGLVAIVALAGRWPLGWWLTPAWGVVGAIGWSLWPERGGPARRLRRLLIGLLAVFQIVVVVLSAARGALIALAAGVLIPLLVVLAIRRAWKALAGTAAAAALLIAFVAALNIPGTPLDPVKRIPALERLSRVADVREGSPGWVRLALWQAILTAWGRQVQGQEILSDASPRWRSLIGYGLESQIFTLDQMTTASLRSQYGGHDNWRARYLPDRAHNEVLDHLVTGGIIGVFLWVAVLAMVLALGLRRLRGLHQEPELAIRLGCLGVVVAHAVDGLVGIATPMPRLLFWLAAAIVTAPPPELREMRVRGSVSPSRGWRIAFACALVGIALLAAGGTRWLFGSMAYAAGVRLGIAGDLPGAHREFQRADDLVPWSPFAADAVADTSLRLLIGESDAQHRRRVLGDAEQRLARARLHVPSLAWLWARTGQVALAQAREGDRSRLSEALAAYERAARLFPRDASVLAQLAFVVDQAGDPRRARQLAQDAVAIDPRAWLAWAVLARSSAQLHDGLQAERSADEARRLAPREASGLVESLVRQ